MRIVEEQNGIMVVTYTLPEDDNKEGAWFRTDFECPSCGYYWLGIAHFSHVGLECPKCHSNNPDFNWLENVMGGTVVDKRKPDDNQ